MSGQKLIRVFNAGALLLILLAAYAGKSLHTHPDEYYRYLTENDANTTSPALVDDCAICHFHFFSYIHSTDWVLDSEFRLLETFFRPECYDPAIVAISGSQLRAPPAIGEINSFRNHSFPGLFDRTCRAARQNIVFTGYSLSSAVLRAVAPAWRKQTHFTS